MKISIINILTLALLESTHSLPSRGLMRRAYQLADSMPVTHGSDGNSVPRRSRHRSQHAPNLTVQPVNGLGSGGSTNPLSRTLKANRAIQRNVETLSDSSFASDNVKSKRNPRFGNKGYFSGTGLDAPASGGGSADQPDLDSEFDNNYTSKNYDSRSDGEIDDAVENLQSGDLSSKGSTTGHSSKEEFGSGNYSSENSSTGDSSLDDEDLDDDLPPLGPPPSEVPKELLEPKGGKGLIKGDFVGSLTGEPRTETGYITGLLSAIPILGSVSRNLGVEQFLKTTGV